MTRTREPRNQRGGTGQVWCVEAPTDLIFKLGENSVLHFCNSTDTTSSRGEPPPCCVRGELYVVCSCYIECWSILCTIYIVLWYTLWFLLLVPWYMLCGICCGIRWFFTSPPLRRPPIGCCHIIPWLLALSVSVQHNRGPAETWLHRDNVGPIQFSCFIHITPSLCVNSIHSIPLHFCALKVNHHNTVFWF